MSVDKRTKAHTIYKVNGVRVPGVTTIIGVLDKPALVSWANGMGLAGIDTTKYVKVAADIGTIAHEMIECELTGKQFDSSPYAAKDIDKATNSMINFLDIVRLHDIEPIHSELVLVHDTLRYGGTCDIYCKFDGKLTLIDIKTSKGIFDEMKIQVSAYKELLKHNGYEVEQVIIARIGKEENDDIELHYLNGSKLDKYFSIFMDCLGIYRKRREISGQEREERKRLQAQREVDLL